LNVLIATGRKAEEIVRNAVDSAADILVLNIDVAAFMTPAMLKKHYLEFTNKTNARYDIILIPGATNVKGYKELSSEIGVKIALGPKQAYDLGLVISLIDEVSLSLSASADTLIYERRRENALKRVEELEHEATCNFMLRNVKIGGNSRMKVLGEILNAPYVDAKKIAKNHIENGADIIDVGIPLTATSDDVKRAVNEVLGVTRPLNVPVSLDTLDPNLILVGVEAGADLILSLTAENAQQIGPTIAQKDIAVVVLPDKGDALGAIELAQSFGIKKILADPILYPIGCGAVTSLMEYKKIRDVCDIPLFLGVGNVTELLEADSIGANAVLAGMAMELRAAVLFTPECSDKARGSIKELKTSSEMMLLAKDRKGSPKDLGIDLLVVKERRRRPEFDIAKGKLIDTRRFDHAKWVPDPHGNFVIGIKDGYILAVHDSEVTIKGKSAKEVLDALLELELVSSLSHAGYLGRELGKAEIALKIGRSYAQDDEF
jgi:dihydropteroate synthase-like protein